MFKDPHLDRLATLMDVNLLRSQVHRANLANVNTPGYKAQAVAFEAAFVAAMDQGTETNGVRPEVFEPRNTATKVDGNDVSSDRETVEIAQAQMLYNVYATLAAGRMKLFETAATPAPGG